MKKVGLLLALALTWASTARALTLSDIETQIRLNVRDTASDTSLRQYSDTVLDAFINEAQREFVNLTWCVEGSTTITVSAGTIFYALPTDFIAVRLGLFTEAGEDAIQLKERLEPSYIDDNPGFETNATGPPAEYFVRQQTDGDNPLEIGFVPEATSTSAGTVRLSYYAAAADLSSDSDTPFNGLLNMYPYHYALVVHTTARVKIIEGRVEEAAYYRQEFDRLVGIAQGRLGDAPNYKPGVRAASK